jgi:chemotaxis protein MotB
MEESDEKKEQPIIIVKKNVVHGGHHGGSWKVAYADFITSMMAFFLVMWLVGQSDPVKQAVAGYFNDPANYGKMKGSSGVLKGTPMVKIPDTRKEKQRELKLLKKTAQNITKTIQQNSSLASLSDQVEMTITSRGLRIQLIDKDEKTAFFEIGSDKLQPNAEKIVSIIAEEIAKLPNEIVIEGHTDRRQYPGMDYTNWELSAERASAARRILTKGGVPLDKIFGIEAYADRFPKIIENPLDKRNRRIAILVLIKSETSAESFYEPGESIY